MMSITANSCPLSLEGVPPTPVLYSTLLDQSLVTVSAGDTHEHASSCNNNSLDKLLDSKYYSFQNLAERKEWYSSAAQAYHDFRPKYPDKIINEALEFVSPGNRVLEIGSGPGTATIALLNRGYDLVCLEPNPHFCAIVRSINGDGLLRVENSSFEEADTEGAEYDAIIAATCMHWIPSEIAFPKAAKSLKDGGSLVLLWNMMLTPYSESELEKVKQAHGADHESLMAWSNETFQKDVAMAVGKLMMESGLFENFRTNQIRQHVTYTSAQYVGLLSTYSFYMRLTPNDRRALFERIQNIIDGELDGAIELSFLSLYHVATKKPAPPKE